MKSKLRERLESPISIGIFIFLIVATLTQWLNRLVEIELRDLVIALNGILGDVIIFAVLIVWINRRRELSDRMRSYTEMLEDFRFWKSEEGVNRKVGILRRLRAMDQPLPSLNRMELEGAYLKGFHMNKVDLSHANLTAAFLLDTQIKQANLRMASLERAYLQNACLEDSQLQEAFVAFVDFRSSNLNRIDATLANFEGAVCWNAQLKRVCFEGANLDKADFDHADLTGAYCAKAVWGQANLKGAILDQVDLRGCDLSQVDGLLPEQLETIYLDEETILPPGFSTIREKLLAKAGPIQRPLPQFNASPPPFRRSAQGRDQMTMSL
ncbi:MAG: pentapeptide repeat-containing protein [Acidobacteria bacterium]|nr:pentapeptide repeat-containing protein [Acidobacteriota bacterium]MCB9398772.1 pentapeptide repeat-containing protein [Acidobacteriota bacterium]